MGRCLELKFYVREVCFAEDVIFFKNLWDSFLALLHVKDVHVAT
jgi:hypothetical protein